MTRIVDVIGFTIEIDGERYDFTPANDPCITEVGKCRPHMAETLDIEWFLHRRAAEWYVDTCRTFAHLLRDKYGAKILDVRTFRHPEGAII